MKLEIFLIESNAIEGITGLRPGEIEAAREFLALEHILIPDVSHLVSLMQPGARLRDRVGLDVRVGDYSPPVGCPEIRDDLNALLFRIQQDNSHDEWDNHLVYERLHPYTDGNGRSGRLLWLWQRLKNKRPVYRNSFLQSFYYDTLRKGSPMLL